MADGSEPPATAGGDIVSGGEPCLTADGAPTTPDHMPRSEDAIRSAHANHDAQRTNSKVRLTPAWLERLDKLLKPMGVENRAHAIYQWIEREEKNQARKK